MPISGRSHHYPQEAGIKQLNRMLLHAMPLLIFLSMVDFAVGCLIVLKYGRYDTCRDKMHKRRNT